jgi:hypothetical protein
VLLSDRDDTNSLPLFKRKSKEGRVDRMADAHSLIARGLFERDVDPAPFVGMRVALGTGEHGRIEGSFGKSGKVRVRVDAGGLGAERHTGAVAVRLDYCKFAAGSSGPRVQQL